MRILLTLSDASTRSACTEYFVTQGCDVDPASDRDDAAPLLRFRAYDAVITDLPMGEETLEMFVLAQRQNALVVPILLATSAPASSVAPFTTLTKPLPLGDILEAVRAHSSICRIAAGTLNVDAVLPG